MEAYKKRVNCERLRVRDHHGSQIKSFKLRELCGPDYEDCVARVIGSDGKGAKPGFLGSIQLTNHLVADSFVEVNDQPVVAPYMDWCKWPKRTMDVVLKAYEKVNELTPKELENFIEAEFEGPSALGASSESSSGSGSPGT